MAIGTPTNLGQAQDNTTPTSKAITTTAAIAAGDLVVVILSLSSSITLPSITDDSSNTYTLVSNVSTNSSRIIIFYAKNATAMTSGGAITASWTTGSKVAMMAATVSGIDPTSPLDKGPTTGFATGASGNSFSQSTGANFAQANELVVGTFSTSAADGGVISNGTGFTALTGITVTADRTLHWAYQVVSSVSAINYDPSWTTLRAYGGNLASFIAASTTVATGSTLGLMGVG